MNGLAAKKVTRGQSHLPCNQAGAVLITSLIMLLILTLLAISMLRSSVFNLKIGGANQVAIQNLALADQALGSSINAVGNAWADGMPSTLDTTTYSDAQNGMEVEVQPLRQLAKCRKFEGPGTGNSYSSPASPSNVSFGAQVNVRDRVFGGGTVAGQGVRVLFAGC